MRTQILLSLLVVSTGSFVAAQDMELPKPSEHMQKLERLVGNFKGTGVVVPMAGGPEIPWESVSQAKMGLDGFVLEDKTYVTGDQMPGPLMMMSVTAWDSQNERFVAMGMGNDGNVAFGEIHWVDANTMVQMTTSMEEGQPVMDRWTTKIHDSGYEFIGHRAVGDGDVFKHVHGKMKRVDDEVTIPEVTEIPGWMPPGDEMKKLNRMAGEYRLEGKYAMGPDMPAMDIGATEMVVPIFGGSILIMHSKGDPTPGFPAYEGYGAFAWDAHKKCYHGIYANNMGEIGENESWFVDGKLVATSTAKNMGVPTAGRGVSEINDKGQMTSATYTAAMGTADPFVVFEATYTFLKGAR